MPTSLLLKCAEDLGGEKIAEGMNYRKKRINAVVITVTYLIPRYSCFERFPTIAFICDVFSLGNEISILVSFCQ